MDTKGGKWRGGGGGPGVMNWAIGIDMYTLMYIKLITNKNLLYKKINKIHTHAHTKDTCTPVFIAAVFTIARSWKQPKCPSTDKWIKKMWYIYTMEYYSAIKRNEIGSFVETWVDLEAVIQSEVSQKEKNKYHALTHICGT